MDLTEFLLARIAEDETVAREHQEYEEDVWEAAGWWSPTRVLAECEAKRWIVRLAQGKAEAYNTQPSSGLLAGGRERAYGELRLLEVVLAALAHPYAQHPDFDPAWSIA